MFRRFVALMTSAALVIGTMPAPLGAQPAPAPVAAPDQTQQGEQFSTAQLEALLAPIALYPDTLLTQLLMATTNPLEIVAASRWLAQGSNRALKGKALEDALRSQPWDPAVKSLVPFPQVLEMLNQQLEWTQQLGYAMQNQEAEVFDAVQRLRARAQTAGTLQSTPQQIVRTEPAPPPPPGATDPRQQNIVIDAGRSERRLRPELRSLAGLWRVALCRRAAGLLRAAARLWLSERAGGGARVRRRRRDRRAALWGWARPNWGCCWGGRYGGVNVNVNRWNAISPARPWRGGGGGVWHGNNPGLRPGGGMGRPGGPVGHPVRPGRSARDRAAAAAGRSAGRRHRSPAVLAVRASAGRPALRDCCPAVPGIGPEFPEAGTRGRSSGGPGRRPGLAPGPGGRPGLPGPGNRPGGAARSRDAETGPGDPAPAFGPSRRSPSGRTCPATTVRPQPVRPEITRPQPRPIVRPAPAPIARPAPIVRPAPIARPAPAPRPAIARPAPGARRPGRGRTRWRPTSLRGRASSHRISVRDRWASPLSR